MSVKSSFYKLSKKDFDIYLDGLKHNPSTITLMSGKYFYFADASIKDKFLRLNKTQWEFDKVFDYFGAFAQKQLIQSFLLEEVQSTNKIENIFSTKHDIFYVLNNMKRSHDSKIISIVNAYSLLIAGNPMPIELLQDISDIYSTLIDSAIDDDDIPDGEFFRKGPVFVTDGVKNIHEGSYPESQINEDMQQFITLYNSSLETYEKMILCHFLIETVHPYYDGNGRLGRYLFSKGIKDATGSTLSLLISKAISDDKEKYYKSFKVARDVHEFGCINEYVNLMVDLLNEKLSSYVMDLKTTLKNVNDIQTPGDLSKSEMAIYKVIAESTILSSYGISNSEIMKETGVSKRTLMTALAKWRDSDLLEETQIGKLTFHKFK